MSEKEITEKYHHFKIKTADGIELDLIEIKYYKELLDLYKQEKEKNKEYEKQLDLDYVDKNFISKDKIKEKLELLKDILKAKEKDGNIYKQIPIEYLKGAIEQLEELLEDK